MCHLYVFIMNTYKWNIRKVIVTIALKSRFILMILNCNIFLVFTKICFSELDSFTFYPKKF